MVVCLVLLHQQYSRIGSNGATTAPHQGSSSTNTHGADQQHTSTEAPAAPSLPQHIVGSAGPAVDVHLLVIWNGAMSKRDKILQHIQEHFYVLDVKYFDWGLGKKGELVAPSDDPQADYFLMNLWRLYSGKGGGGKTSMALKTRQCGRGPFIGLVVVDPNPAYRTESTAHGDDYVNHNMNDAKKLYRKWSGGGFRVHGTFNPTEAAHDVTLMFHKHPQVYAQEFRNFGGSAGMKQRTATLLKSFQEHASWPPGPGSPHYGPEGTLGLHSREAFRLAMPELPPWTSCHDMIDAITSPWPSKEQRRLREESIYGWDAEASYPTDALKIDDCASWPNEWALVVPEQNWWGIASLLNAHITPELLSAATEGKPQAVEVHITGRSTPHRIHVRGMIVDATESRS